MLRPGAVRAYMHMCGQVHGLTPKAHIHIYRELSIQSGISTLVRSSTYLGRWHNRRSRTSLDSIMLWCMMLKCIRASLRYDSGQLIMVRRALTELIYRYSDFMNFAPFMNKALDVLLLRLIFLPVPLGQLLWSIDAGPWPFLVCPQK